MPRQQGSASEGGVVPDEAKKSKRTFRSLFRGKKSRRDLDAVSSSAERPAQDEVPVATPITSSQAADPSAPGPSTSKDHSQTVAPGPSAAAAGTRWADAGPDPPASPAAPRAAAAAASSGQAVLPVSSQTLPQVGKTLPDQLSPAAQPTAHPTAQSTAQPASMPLQAEGVKPRLHAPSVVQDDLARAAAQRGKQAAALAAQPRSPNESPLRPMPAAQPISLDGSLLRPMQAAQSTSPDGSPLKPRQAASPAATPETQNLQQGWVAVTPQQGSLPDKHSQTAPRQVTPGGLHDRSAHFGAPQIGRPDVPTDEEMAILDTGDTTWNHIILQHTNLARRSAPLERSPAGIQVRLVKHPEAHTTPVQAHSTLPRASLAQDNPVFEEDKAPAYSRQQENPLFEEGQGTALSGRGLGAPQHWTSDLKPGPLRERFQPVSPPERWAGMLQTDAWQPGPSTSPTATTTAAAHPAATAGPSTAGRQATSAPAAAAITSGPGASEAPSVSVQHSWLLSEDSEVLRVSDQPILTGGFVQHRPPTLPTDSSAQPLQGGSQQQQTAAAGATREHPLTDLGSQAGTLLSATFVETASESDIVALQEREGDIEEPGSPGGSKSRMQTEEPAAEGAAQSGGPSKHEQPYSASRVSTLAAHLEQAQAGYQVAAGHPAGAEVEPHRTATDATAAAQQPSTAASQKDMVPEAAAEGAAASRPGQLHTSRTPILLESAQRTEARPEAQAGTRQVQASEQQELAAAAADYVQDRQPEGGIGDAQAPQAAAADVHHHDPLLQQQQQTQAEQPSAVEAPAGQQEGLLQGPHGPLGPHGPQKGALHGTAGPQAEQQAGQSAATAAADEQDASRERPGAAASGRPASPTAEPARAEAPPQGNTADTEQAAAGSAQAAAADSAARASVLAALASTPAEAAAVNAAWEGAAAAAERRLPTAVERRQTPTPAAPASTGQPAGHRRVSSEPSAIAMPPRPRARAASAVATEEESVARAGQPSLSRTSGDHVGGEWGPSSRESSVAGREYPAGPPPSPAASEQRTGPKVYQQTFWRQQDHPILVERITRLQQPLQYEREYIAETRFTGRRRAANRQPVADEVLRSREEHLEEGLGRGSSLHGVPDQYHSFFKAGPLESPRPPDPMQSEVLATPGIEAEVPLEPGSAPRLADVRVRVPAPAPAVAEERVRVAVRERPPEVFDDGEQSPRYDPAARKYGPRVYIAELLPAEQRAEELRPLGRDRSDTARIETDVLHAVRQSAPAGSGVGKQPLAEPCAPVTSGPLGVATPVSPPLPSTGLGASTSRAPRPAMPAPAPAPAAVRVRVQVPQRERRESVRLFLGDPDNSPRYDPAARRHGEDVYPVLAAGAPVAADSPRYDPAARKYGPAMYGAPFATPQAPVGIGVEETVADTAGTGEGVAEGITGFAPESTAPEPSPAGMSMDSIGKPATPEAVPPAFAVPRDVLPAPSPVAMAVPYAEERAFAARQSRGLASPSRVDSVDGAAGIGARKRPRWGWLDIPMDKPKQSRQAPLWGTGAMQEEFSTRPASPLPQRRAAGMQPLPARWATDFRGPTAAPWPSDGSAGLYTFGGAPVARGRRRQDADMVQWEMAEAFELQYISAQAG